MKVRSFKGTGTLAAVIVAVGVGLCALAWFYPTLLGLSSRLSGVLFVWGLAASALLMVLGYQRLTGKLGRSLYPASTDTEQTDVDASNLEAVRISIRSFRNTLNDHYGPLWRSKTRLILIAGEPAQIDAIAPGLAEQRWLVGEKTVLLWAGSLLEAASAANLALWHSLTRWRGLDGLVWAVTREQSLDEDAMGTAQTTLRNLARDLHWQLPLYLWQVSERHPSQADEKSRPVGCLLAPDTTPAQLEAELVALQAPLRHQGLAQMKQNKYHDFLLRTSGDLRNGGIKRWLHVLSPWFGGAVRGLSVRGLWFSLALPPRIDSKLGHLWLADASWQGVINDRTRSRRTGWQAPRIAHVSLLVLALLWGGGMLVSFAANRALIDEVQTALTTLDKAEQGDAQLLALNDVVRELARLDYRAKEGAPWHQRLGLNQNDKLLEVLWPRYLELNARLLRDPAVAALETQLQALVNLPPDSPERTRRAAASYDLLEAWLMMARPEKADPAFLTRVMSELEPTRAGMSEGAWHALAPGLWDFYGEHLEAHPAVALKPPLLSQVRRVLLGQLGQRNAESSLYQDVLNTAAGHYPDLHLDQMLGDTDAVLFTSRTTVPGVFTRQAWEGQVRQAIDKVAEARRDEIDWVLSDNHGEIASDLTPEVLKQRLTDRYFEDYSSAWLSFLNSLRWQRAGSLAEVIDQLTVMSDVRQSPLLALMETLAWQGRAGTREQALADSLLQSAQQMLGKDQDKAQLLERAAAHLDSPLDDTFGPLLTLLGKDPDAQGGDERLSLQAFLTRVTRVRLKLQQISNAADPRDMTQALAQTVFQGKSVDLSDTRAYGSLIAASLGAEWGTVGETLFVQPLDQAWQRVLQPSAASLNTQWQRAVVNEWSNAFEGRYPFVATDSDASIPMLGQMIRSGSGRIDQFLSTQLSGVLRKEGSRWVADPQHSQGLRFNPKFLTAVNELSHLADVLYTDGGLGLSFELRGKPVRNVVETLFVLNGDKHHYFNQKERWQRFSWPGYGDHLGTRVSWTGVGSGERMYGDYQGTWGLIRWLENARVTLLDDGKSRYHLEVRAPDGLELTWHLRTELGEGPLALLRLRGFVMPKQIFIDESNVRNKVGA